MRFSWFIEKFKIPFWTLTFFKLMKVIKNLFNMPNINIFKSLNRGQVDLEVQKMPKYLEIMKNY